MPQPSDYIARQIQGIKALLRDRNYEGAIHAATTFLGAIPDEEEVQNLLAQAKEKFIDDKVKTLDQFFPKGKESERIAFVEKLLLIDKKNKKLMQEVERLKGLLKTQKTIQFEEKITDIEKLENEGRFAEAWKGIAAIREDFPKNKEVKRMEKKLKRSEARAMKRELGQSMGEEQKRLKDLAKKDRKKFRKI